MASNKKEWRWPVLIFSNFFPLDQINPYWWCWWQICSIERRYIDLIEKRKKYWPTQTSITSQYLFQFLPLDSHTQAGSASPPHNNSLGSVVSLLQWNKARVYPCISYIFAPSPHAHKEHTQRISPYSHALLLFLVPNTHPKFDLIVTPYPVIRTHNVGPTRIL